MTTHDHDTDRHDDTGRPAHTRRPDHTGHDINRSDGTTAPHSATRLADDTGSQAMEYGMLAAGGAGVIGLIITLLQSEPVQSRLGQLLVDVFDALSGTLGHLL